MRFSPAAAILVTLFTLNALAAPLPDMTSFSVRGSFAFTERQLAIELFGILPSHPEKPNLRQQGFVSCTSHGRSISSWVDCTLSVKSRGQLTLAGRIELESMNPKTLRVEVSEPGLFLKVPENSDWISCQITEEAARQICIFRLE